MKNKIKYIIFFLIIVLFLIGISLYIITTKKEDNNEILEEEYNFIGNTESEPIIINVEKNEIVEENVETNTQEKTKDAADLTQEIYNINGPIGTLYIPKTGLNTQIYSNVTVDEMESMPCFLYTTGGLNKKGVTLFVGHNRRNGKIFSDNNNLENGDKFYFKDLDGTELEYTVYSKFVTTENDTSFLTDDVDSPTIALSCCTDDDDDYRIIILGRADN